MSRARLSDPGHSAARTAAALLLTGPTAVAVSIALVYALPAPFEWRLVIGAYAAIPVWIALIWGAFVARSAYRACFSLIVILVAALLACALGRGAS